MKIKKVKVENLFDAFSYEIEFKEHDSISIIHAPNGYGKTTVFRIINSIFSFDFEVAFDVPFDVFSVELQDDYIVTIDKSKLQDMVPRRMRREIFSGEISYLITKKEEEIVELKLPISPDFYDYCRSEGFENAIRRMEMRRRHVPVEERDDMVNVTNKYEKYKETIEALREGSTIRFIDANRLYSNQNRGFKSEAERDIPYGAMTREERRIMEIRREQALAGEKTREQIVVAANDIFSQIQLVRQRYSLISEKMDRDFPDRLVGFYGSSESFYNDEEIAEKLIELEEKRKELENTGLVLKGKKSLAPTENIDDTMRKFYTLYINDTLDKLRLYDDIKQKLELFIEIINTTTRFSNKMMRIDNENGIVFEPIKSVSGKKKIIPLAKLSSGEKHDFILFYELIFQSDENTIFLIDEPEISLHVAWQMEFINVLERICENHMQAIIATHSPDIVNGHDDLLISLGLEEDM
ncbi:MAG: AAA family ATPase [Lachnospiraceae bacterium]|nr:AAA family ATPase [Lachnospiraceae bacterium]